MYIDPHVVPAALARALYGPSLLPLATAHARAVSERSHSQISRYASTSHNWPHITRSTFMFRVYLSLKFICISCSISCSISPGTLQILPLAADDSFRELVRRKCLQRRPNPGCTTLASTHLAATAAGALAQCGTLAGPPVHSVADSWARSQLQLVAQLGRELVAGRAAAEVTLPLLAPLAAPPCTVAAAAAAAVRAVV